MDNPKIKTKVVHSNTKDAFNLIGTTLGAKYKIARIPYLVTDNKAINEREKAEAKSHAAYNRSSGF